MADKKLIATTVSSREKGIRRREEGGTTSIQKTSSLQRNQEEGRDNLMKVDDDSPGRTEMTTAVAKERSMKKRKAEAALWARQSIVS